VVIAMNENENRRAELLHDIAQREARRDRGEEPAMWVTPDERPRRRKTFATPTQQTADWSGWDRWCKAHIERTLAEQPIFSKAQISAIGEALSTIRTELRKEIGEQLGQLRADMAVDRAVNRGEVSALRGSVPTRRGRDVA
jgi:hypothetical protein